MPHYVTGHALTLLQNWTHVLASTQALNGLMLLIIITYKIINLHSHCISNLALFVKCFLYI